MHSTCTTNNEKNDSTTSSTSSDSTTIAPRSKNDMSRRSWVSKLIGSSGCILTGTIVSSTSINNNPALAAETVGKDVDCNDASCIGEFGDLLFGIC